MKFPEVIEGLKRGENFARFKAPHFYGKFITMQIPADIPTDVIPKMTSLNDHAKQILGTVGDYSCFTCKYRINPHRDKRDGKYSVACEYEYLNKQ